MKSRRGFTLIELLVVIAIVAIGSALASLALPDSDRRTLAREGERLAALLEAARAQSRAAGVPVRWRATASGFAWDGLPPGAAPLPTGCAAAAPPRRPTPASRWWKCWWRWPSPPSR